jgi:hypothetical protein
MWTIRIERQYWSGGPTAADCSLIKENERREVNESLSLVDGLGRAHQIRILGPAGRGLRIAVEDLSVKRGAQLQSSGIDLTVCRPQELVVDFARRSSSTPALSTPGRHTGSPSSPELPFEVASNAGLSCAVAFGESQ